MTTLNPNPNSCSKRQVQTLVLEARKHGFTLEDVHQMVGGAITRLSAAEASDWIKRFSGKDLPNPPGQKPSAYKGKPQPGVTRKITADHIDQIERLMLEYFDYDRPRARHGQACRRRHRGIKDHAQTSRTEGSQTMIVHGMNWWRRNGYLLATAFFFITIGVGTGLLVVATVRGITAAEITRSKPAPSDNVSVLCHRLFAEGARPHVLTVQSAEGIAWLLQTENLSWMRKHQFGHVILWSGIYTNGPNPVDGQYIYKDPSTVAAAQAAIRDYGMTVIGYVGGWNCKQAKMTPFDILDEIERHGWDGVMLDNGHAGSTVWQTDDFFRRLHNRGLIIVHHATSEPHFGRYIGWRGPWARFEDYVIVGEGEIPANDPHDPYWRHAVSQVDVSSAIVLYKGQFDDGSPEDFFDRRPGWLGTARIYPWVSTLKKWEERFYPAWLARAEEYRRDPEAFVRDPFQWPDPNRDREGADTGRMKDEG
ncbi:MAG: hypothetical protein WBE26_02705 [Phycisphaerae bacterium]